MTVAENPLTQREYEIAGLVRGGYSNKRIADTLGLTLGTVQIALEGIYKKLRIDTGKTGISRTLLAVWYVKRKKEMEKENSYYIVSYHIIGRMEVGGNTTQVLAGSKEEAVGIVYSDLRMMYPGKEIRINEDVYVSNKKLRKE